jgi:hypothetical protein
MNRTRTRKFRTWNAVQLALKKSKLPNHGTTATLLLETFLENDGRLLASKVISLGLCEEGLFREWRKNFLDREWLKWSEAQTDKGQYYPGKKLLPYINKEKLLSKEIVTKDEVLSKHEAATKAELQEVKERLSKVECGVEEIYRKLNLGEPDPPHYKKLQDKVIPKEECN